MIEATGRPPVLVPPARARYSRAHVGSGYRHGRRGRAAERPLNPGEQLIDLPTVVTSHGHVKFMHGLTSTRLQAARPAAGGATAATG